MKNLSFLLIISSISIILVSACVSNNKNKQNNPIDSSNVSNVLKTTDNLKSAIIQEKNAKAKYNAYAIKAKEEGFIPIQLLFNAVSQSTSIHIANLTKALEKMGGKVEETTPVYEIKTTKENIEEAIKTEKNKISNIYPPYMKLADSEGENDASIAYSWMNDTKIINIDLLNECLTAINNNNIKNLSTVYYVCPKCGNTYKTSTVEDNCSFCGTGKEKFIIFK